MRTLAALLLIIATIGWAVVAQAALFAVLATAEYTLLDGIFIAVIYLVAPLILAMAWTLFLRRRLLAGSQIRTAAKVVIVLVGFVAFAWLTQVTIGS